MRICAGIISWQDGPALRNAVASVYGHVDEIVIVDGIIAGIDPQGLPPYDDPGDAEETDMNEMRREFGARVHVCAFQAQAAKRTKLLRYCQRDYYNCDWLLVIDADEQLNNGEQLREWLGRHDERLPSISLPTDDGFILSVRLLHVASWRRYVVGAHTLEDKQGRLVQLMRRQLQTRPPGPWVEHWPELRPEPRRAIRLGALAATLEQPVGNFAPESVG